MGLHLSDAILNDLNSFRLRSIKFRTIKAYFINNDTPHDPFLDVNDFNYFLYSQQFSLDATNLNVSANSMKILKKILFEKFDVVLNDELDNLVPTNINITQDPHRIKFVPDKLK